MLARSVVYMKASRNPYALPLVAVVLQSPWGSRLWSDLTLAEDEAWIPTDSKLIEISPRLLDAGSPDESDVQSDTLDGMLSSEMRRQISDVMVSISNADLGPSKALAHETWISARLYILFGFRGLYASEWLQRFAGIVQRVTVTKERVSLQARAV